MKTIKGYPLMETAHQTVEMPRGSTLVSVTADAKGCTLWAAIDAGFKEGEKATELRSVYSFITGDLIPPGVELDTPIGSMQTLGRPDPRVLHFFDGGVVKEEAQ